MPVTCGRQGSILTITVNGNYPFTELMDALQRALADPGRLPETALLFDERLSQASPPSEEVRNRVAWVASLRSQGVSRQCALLIRPEPHRYGLARMQSVYFELRGMQAEIFTDAAEAREWLSWAAARQP